FADKDAAVRGGELERAVALAEARERGGVLAAVGAQEELPARGGREEEPVGDRRRARARAEGGPPRGARAVLHDEQHLARGDDRPAGDRERDARDPSAGALERDPARDSPGDARLGGAGEQHLGELLVALFALVVGVELGQGGLVDLVLRGLAR